MDKIYIAHPHTMNKDQVWDAIKKDMALSDYLAKNRDYLVFISTTTVDKIKILGLSKPIKSSSS